MPRGFFLALATAFSTTFAVAGDGIESDAAAVEIVFKTWEERSKKFERVETSFDRYTYHTDMGHETRSRGYLFAERSDQLRADLYPVAIDPDEVSSRFVNTGQRFTIESVDRASSWICTSKSVRVIDYNEQVDSVVNFPQGCEDFLSLRLYASCEVLDGWFRITPADLWGVPACFFLFGPPDAELRSHWDWNLGTQHHWSPDSMIEGDVHLHGRPNDKGRAQGYEVEIDILLQGEAFSPKAIRYRRGKTKSVWDICVFDYSTARTNQPWSQPTPFEVVAAAKHLTTVTVNNGESNARNDAGNK